MHKKLRTIFILHSACFIIAYFCPDSISENGNSCNLNDERRTSGNCVNIAKCEYVKGNLANGIIPQLCTKGKNEVCCPTHPRISEQKCEEYKNVLKSPLPGSKESHKIPVCESFLFQKRISGGRDAFPREFPYQVGLGYGKSSDAKIGWKCGGVLISSDFVLTASHCVLTKFGPPTKVLLGEITLTNDPSTERRIVDVSETIPHPEFKPPLLYNDIALVKLSTKVNFSRAIRPACLPKSEDRLERRSAVDVSGWGQMGAVGYQQSTILKTVQLNKFSMSECNKFIQDDQGLKQRVPDGIKRSQFCAGDKVGIKDSCQGDSGGPAVVAKGLPCIFYAVGIVSFGGLCGFQQPGVYTNVQSYLDWIENVVWPLKPKKSGQNEDLIFFPTILPKSSTATSITITTTAKPTLPNTGVTATTKKYPEITTKKSPNVLFLDDATTHAKVLVRTTTPMPPQTTGVTTTPTILKPSTKHPIVSTTSQTPIITTKKPISTSKPSKPPQINKQTPTTIKTPTPSTVSNAKLTQETTITTAPSSLTDIPLSYLQKLCESSDSFKIACETDEIKRLLAAASKI